MTEMMRAVEMVSEARFLSLAASAAETRNVVPTYTLQIDIYKHEDIQIYLNIHIYLYICIHIYIYIYIYGASAVETCKHCACIDRQAHRHTGIQTHRRTVTQAHRKTDRQKVNRPAGIQADRQTNRPTDI